MMRRLLMWAVSVPALVATLAMPAMALRAVPVAMAPPGPQRVALSDAVLVGRVTALEDKDVEVDIPGSQQKMKYRIAIVTVAEDIRNAKDVKTVRVGFLPPAEGQPNQPIRPIRPGLQRMELKVGQEGLFYLTKHGKESFYLVPNYYDVTAKEAPNFKKDHEEAKVCAKLLADPMVGLKSKDSKERLMTAMLLITQYRSPRTGGAKLEAINADESKLILTALADADWSQPGGRVDQIHPMNLFNQLGVTAKDGFQRPTKITSPQDYPNAMRAWLKENAGKFRIQRYVGGTPINTGGLDPRSYIDPVVRPPIEIRPPQK